MDPPSTPVHQHSLNRQLILEEDEYTTALSQIIARDFFPSLLHLEATNGYLDALNSRDPHLINASIRRMEQVSTTPALSSSRRAPHQTPSRTPYNSGPSETPVYTTPGERPNKRPRLDTSLSLDAFQARYTSEDNSSFTQILDDENRKRKERWAWAWDAQKRVEAQRDKMIEAREKMLIEAPPATGVKEKFMIELPTPAGLLTVDGETSDDLEGLEKKEAADKVDDPAASQNKEIVISNSNDGEGDTQLDVMAQKRDMRTAGVDGWKFKARNSLMFPPDADSSPYHPPLSSTKTESDPKFVKYESTRLLDHDHSNTEENPVPPSPTRSRIDAAITDTPYLSKPPINKFPLVPNLPSPTASELGPNAVKQLMTWGTLNATPRVISKSNDPVDLPPPTTPFHLPAISQREAISQRLSNNASKSLRTKAGLLGLSHSGHTPNAGISKLSSGAGLTGKRKGDMAPPTWTPRLSEAAGNLTPAAKRLLERSTMGTAAARRAGAMERSAAQDKGIKGKEKDLNRVRWTPTPGHG